MLKLWVGNTIPLDPSVNVCSHCCCVLDDEMILTLYIMLHYNITALYIYTYIYVYLFLSDKRCGTHNALM